MDYINKRTLSKIGYRFDPDDLTDFEVEYLREIHRIFKNLENEDLKNTGSKK